MIARDFEGGEFALRFEGCRWIVDGGGLGDSRAAFAEREQDRRRNALGPVKQGLLLILESDPREWTTAQLVDAYDGEASADRVCGAIAEIARADRQQKRPSHLPGGIGPEHFNFERPRLRSRGVLNVWGAYPAHSAHWKARPVREPRNINGLVGLAAQFNLCGLCGLCGVTTPAALLAGGAMRGLESGSRNHHNCHTRRSSLLLRHVQVTAGLARLLSRPMGRHYAATSS